MLQLLPSPGHRCLCASAALLTGQQPQQERQLRQLAVMAPWTLHCWELLRRLLSLVLLVPQQG